MCILISYHCPILSVCTENIENAAYYLHFVRRDGSAQKASKVKCIIP